jgi:hypothetical protein
MEPQVIGTASTTARIVPSGRVAPGGIRLLDDVMCFPAACGSLVEELLLLAVPQTADEVVSHLFERLLAKVFVRLVLRPDLGLGGRRDPAVDLADVQHVGGRVGLFRVELEEHVVDGVLECLAACRGDRSVELRGGRGGGRVEVAEGQRMSAERGDRPVVTARGGGGRDAGAGLRRFRRRVGRGPEIQQGGSEESREDAVPHRHLPGKSVRPASAGVPILFFFASR